MSAPQPPDVTRTVTVDAADFGQLLAVATLYLSAFADDEAMTLPERLRLAEVERIVEQYGPRS